MKKMEITKRSGLTGLTRHRSPAETPRRKFFKVVHPVVFRGRGGGMKNVCVELLTVSSGSQSQLNRTTLTLKRPLNG